MYQISTKQPRDHTFRTAGRAWNWAMAFIKENGIDVRTEDNQLTREYRNLLITTTEPGLGWPIAGSGWDMEGLNKYADQLLSTENPGFDYTYGERIRKCIHRFGLIKRFGKVFMDDVLLKSPHATRTTQVVFGVDQIEVACQMLAENPNTRRAPMRIWMPETDLGSSKHVPCMLFVDPLIRAGTTLHLAAMFRSHDIGQAYPQNLYGLWRLMCHMAGRISELNSSHVVPGSITTWSVSAHYYIE